LLELVQNRFPFPNDLPPIELMMYITQGEVCFFILNYLRLSIRPDVVHDLQPPQLEDEPGVEWSEEMKDFIKAA